MSSRDAILMSIREAHDARGTHFFSAIPKAAQVPVRLNGDPNAEMELLLAEIASLHGSTRTLENHALDDAVAELVRGESIRTATVWQTPDLLAMDVERKLVRLGVEILSPKADRYVLAQCDLGITGVDAALPETGTLVLGTGARKPGLVSLLPRVHLAIVTTSALRSDLPDVLRADQMADGLLFITGPSRTVDIEMTLTIGVHGPKALYVWAVR